jgi:hypothetical protein
MFNLLCWRWTWRWRLESLGVVSSSIDQFGAAHVIFSVDTYSITLPDNLPPTYKGRSLKFSYELVVGTCRAANTLPPSSALGPTGANSISRVMKVPIRVYNHVAGTVFFCIREFLPMLINPIVDNPPVPYDLLWPVTKRTKSTVESAATVEEVAGKTAAIPRMLPFAIHLPH